MPLLGEPVSPTSQATLHPTSLNEHQHARSFRSTSARLTPELTRAEHIASNMKEQDNDESHAIEASGSMSCSAAGYLSTLPATISRDYTTEEGGVVNHFQR
jgi:hypothetical protein